MPDPDWSARCSPGRLPPDFPDGQRLKYIASATELEITNGALKVADANEHVFCFFRHIPDIPIDRTAEKFLDLDPTGRHPDVEALNGLKDLKRRLRAFPGNVFDYEARCRTSRRVRSNGNRCLRR